MKKVKNIWVMELMKLATCGDVKTYTWLGFYVAMLHSI